MTKIYIAAPKESSAKAFSLRHTLENIGAKVVSDWHNHGKLSQDGTLNDIKKREIADIEFEQIDSCDIMIVLQYGSGQGHACEMGYALGAKKQVYLVSDYQYGTLFFHASKVIRVSIEHAVIAIENRILLSEVERLSNELEKIKNARRVIAEINAPIGPDDFGGSDYELRDLQSTKRESVTLRDAFPSLSNRR